MRMSITSKRQTLEQWIRSELMFQGDAIDPRIVLHHPVVNLLRNNNVMRYRTIMEDVLRMWPKNLFHIPDCWCDDDMRHAIKLPAVEDDSKVILQSLAQKFLNGRQYALPEIHRQPIASSPTQTDTCDVCGQQAIIEATLSAQISGNKRLMALVCGSCDSQQNGNGEKDGNLILCGRVQEYE